MCDFYFHLVKFTSNELLASKPFVIQNTVNTKSLPPETLRKRYETKSFSCLKRGDSAPLIPIKCPNPRFQCNFSQIIVGNCENREKWKRRKTSPTINYYSHSYIFFQSLCMKVSFIIVALRKILL